MVTVINSVIDRFSWVDSVWLAASTVRLQVYDYNQLSDYNCTECSVKNIAADAPIIRGEMLMVMIQAFKKPPCYQATYPKLTNLITGNMLNQFYIVFRICLLWTKEVTGKDEWMESLLFARNEHTVPLD